MRRKLTPEEQAPQSLIDAHHAAGLNVIVRLHEGGRHEMLHETNRAEVMSGIAAWLNSNLALRSSG